MRVCPGPDPSHPFVDDVTAKLTDDPHADRPKASLWLATPTAMMLVVLPALSTAAPGTPHPESGRSLRLIVSAAPSGSCGWTGVAPQDASHELLAPRSSSSVTIPVKSLRAIRPVLADRPAPATRLKNAWFSQRVGRSRRNSPLR